MPILTCGSTTMRNAWRREAPSVMALISMSHGHGVEEALHHEDGEGQLQRGDDEDDAGERVEEPDPVA